MMTEINEYYEMPGPCIECKYFGYLNKHDHSCKPVEHSWEEGYACTAFMAEGSVIHLVGCDEHEPGCEMFVGREYENTVQR